MAKVVGLVGAASGKIGNLVYVVTNGIQTARVYQPVVSNPKTALQNAQRAKGNLAGRMSSFVPREAIMGLGINNRARRGEFLRGVLKSAVVSQSGGVYNASVAEEDVIFSKGSVMPMFTSTHGVVASVNAVNITLQAQPEAVIAPAIYDSLLTRLVVLYFDADKNLMRCVTKIANKPEQGQTPRDTIFPVIEGAYNVSAYAVPMSTADGSAANVSTDLVNLDDDSIAANLSLNSNAVVFKYGRSVFLGSAQFTPSSAKDEEGTKKKKS